MKKSGIVFALAALVSCNEGTVVEPVKNILVSTDLCEKSSFSSGDRFLLWTDGQPSSVYALYGKSFSLAEGDGVKAEEQTIYAAFPESAFDPLAGTVTLPESIAASDGCKLPVSGCLKDGVLKKMILAPASAYLDLSIFGGSAPTTLYSITVKADVALCGKGSVAYCAEDGRPYVSYAAGQGSNSVTVDAGEATISESSPFNVTIPIPGCITLSSLVIEYKLTEGDQKAAPTFSATELGLGESFSVTIGNDTYNKQRNTRPYNDIDWDSVCQITTTSHVHCDVDRVLQNLQKRGVEFFTLSNYYPSAPTWPAAEVKYGRRGVPVSDWPVLVDGELKDGPFDWNEIITWKDQLAASYKNELPFKESDDLKFPSWKAGALEAPNAEHFDLLPDGKYYQLHMCCPGSSYASGTFDAHDYFQTRTHGYSFGCNLNWRKGVDNMIDGLIIPDGGGVTINHPGWSDLPHDLICDILDYDARILGMEAYCACDNDEDYWDAVLATGRQCFGFFVPDHQAEAVSPVDSLGFNILLVHEKTVNDCLRAYRKGNFYGALRGYGELRFTKINFDGKVLRASTDRQANFEVIDETGIAYTCTGTSMEYTPGKHVYVRIRAKAADGCGEILYSQPFML